MFNTKIPLYGIMIIVALISNVIIIFLTYNKNNYTKEEIIGAVIYENMGIILGAKILAFLQNINLYNGEFNILKVGLSAYGGVIGGLICILLFALQFKKSYRDILITFFIPIPLMYSIGKIGCFLVGCCNGIKYSGIGGVIYKYALHSEINNISLFPIQLVESIVFLLIFIFIIIFIKKNKFNIKTFGYSIMMCGVSKFLLEYLRMSHEGVFLSSTQVISLLFIILSLFLIRKKELVVSN